MAFWNLAASEPKRQHRYLINFTNLTTSDGSTYQEYLAMTTGTPGFTINPVTHKFLGNEYHYPGSVTWDEISCTLVNSVDPDGNALLYNALLGSGYLTPDEQAGAFNSGDPVGTVNKADSLAALGDVIIRELDGEGGIVGTWTLNNGWISSAKFGDLDYSGDGILNLTLTIRYDWASYETGAAAGLASAFSTTRIPTPAI